MDEAEAAALLREHLNQLRRRSYGELVTLIDNPTVLTVMGPSGSRYQVETEAHWDSRPDADLRILGTIDDGGWRSFVPLCQDFIITAGGGTTPDSRLHAGPATLALAHELGRLGFLRRMFVAALMGGVTILLMLTSKVIWDLGHWAGRLLLAFFVEPLTLFLAFGAAYCLFPTSALGRGFMFLLPRAKRVILILLGGFAVAILIGMVGTFLAIVRQA